MVTNILSRHGIQFKISGENAIADCPICHGGDHHDKGTFAVNVESGAWNCLRGKCGRAGSIYDLKMLFGENEEPKFMNTKKQYTRPKVKFEPLPAPAKEWLTQTRMLTEEALKYYKVTCVDGKIAFPFLRDGKTENVKYRGKGDDGKWKEFTQEKGCRPCLFGADNVSPESETLYITEGEIDAISLYQYGIKDVVSIHGGAKNDKWIAEEWDWLTRFKAIYLIMDDDEAGHEAESAFSKRLGLWRCRMVKLPLNDANECLCKGVPAETILKAIQEAKEIQHEKLRRVKEFEAEIIDTLTNPLAHAGIPIGFKQIHWLLKGWRTKEVTIWTGSNGSGKSTILGQTMIDLATKNIMSCVASMELPAKRYLTWQVNQITGQALPKQTDIKAAVSWLNNFQLVADFVGEIKPQEVLEVFEFAARKYNCKHFVIDSLLKVKVDIRDKYESQKAFVNMLTDFAKQFDCHIHLVAHPRKGESDHDEPGKVDVGGSSAITDLADNVIIITRNMKDFMGGNIYVKKNREFGFLGKALYTYNSNSRRFATEGDVINYNYKEEVEDEWTD